MISNYQLYSQTHFNKLKERGRKGIPEGMRGMVWPIIAGVSNFKMGRENLYKDLLSKLDKKDFIETKEEEVIIRDLHRTFPKNMVFMTRLGEGQRALYRILMCYAAYNKKTGYVQGMGFLAALFLTYMNEENSFWMLACIMEKYGLQEVYEPGFPGLKKKLYIFLGLTRKFFPKLYLNLKRKEVYPTMYASQWFFTYFTNTFPFEIVVRIIDCLLLEGEKIIFRIALAIFKLKNDQIMKEKGFETTMEVLKNVTHNIDIDVLLKESFALSLSRKDINALEEEYNKNINNQNDELMSQVGY